MARVSFVTARAAAARRVRNTRGAYRRRWLRFRRRLRVPLDAQDRALVAVWAVRACAVLAAASTLGLAVRLFGMTSGLF